MQQTNLFSEFTTSSLERSTKTGSIPFARYELDWQFENGTALAYLYETRYACQRAKLIDQFSIAGEDLKALRDKINKTLADAKPLAKAA